MDDLIHVSPGVGGELHLGAAADCHTCQEWARFVAEVDERLTHRRALAALLEPIVGSAT